MSVAYERDAAGRETARSAGRIVGHIVPDAFGRGGWVWVFVPCAQGMAIPVRVASRDAAHAHIEKTLAS